MNSCIEEIRTFQGIIPICTSCKNIRDDKGYWNNIETYIREHYQAKFTHCICPEGAKNFIWNLFNETPRSKQRGIYPKRE